MSVSFYFSHKLIANSKEVSIISWTFYKYMYFRLTHYIKRKLKIRVENVLLDSISVLSFIEQDKIIISTKINGENNSNDSQVIATLIN